MTMPPAKGKRPNIIFMAKQKFSRYFDFTYKSRTLSGMNISLHLLCSLAGTAPGSISQWWRNRCMTRHSDYFGGFSLLRWRWVYCRQRRWRSHRGSRRKKNYTMKSFFHLRTFTTSTSGNLVFIAIPWFESKNKVYSLKYFQLWILALLYTDTPKSVLPPSHSRNY